MAPELVAIKDRVDANHRELKERIDANHRETSLRFDALSQRFDDLIQRLNLERRIESLEDERGEQRAS